MHFSINASAIILYFSTALIPSLKNSNILRADMSKIPPGAILSVQERGEMYVLDFVVNCPFNHPSEWLHGYIRTAHHSTDTSLAHAQNLPMMVSWYKTTQLDSVLAPSTSALQLTWVKVHVSPTRFTDQMGGTRCDWSDHFDHIH